MKAPSIALPVKRFVLTWNETQEERPKGGVGAGREVFVIDAKDRPELNAKGRKVTGVMEVFSDYI
jgi:hypothetical protein